MSIENIQNSVKQNKKSNPKKSTNPHSITFVYKRNKADIPKKKK